MQMTNSEVLKLVNLIWILVFVETGGIMVGWSEIENKLKKNNKRNLLEVSGR